ncbi:MAG: hypothetical protein PVH61_42695, partial [Candidatus Aminicenantes bacterium]
AGNSLEAGFEGEQRNSPLERGASSTLFNSPEEAGCVARGYVLRLDKMLILVTFLPVPNFTNFTISFTSGNLFQWIVRNQ